VGTLVGLVLFALGGSAIAAPPTTLGDVGLNGPTPPKLGDPAANQMEIQWITITVTAVNPSGTYTLNTGSGTTAGIGFGTNANGFQTATSPATAIGAMFPAGAAVTAVGGPTSPNYDNAGKLKPSAFYWRVAFGGNLAGTDVATMTANDAGLTGATVTVDPYRDGQTFAGRVQPHGGYSASTDYCVQCHSVHGAADEYALLAGASVTATCQTCHSVFGSAVPGAAPPGGNPFAASAPTSVRAAYEITPNPAAQHGIGTQLRAGVFSTKTITISGWGYSAGPIKSADGKTTTWASNETEAPGGRDAGLYCGDCHTPHGDFGQLVNSKFFRSTAGQGNVNGGSANLTTVQNFVEDAPSYAGGGTTVRYLHYDAARNVWQGCADTADNGCTDLVVSDTEGESAYLYGYKLLSAYPNHSWSDGPESWSMDARSHDGARWCGRCHDLATPVAYGGTAHSHPTGCTTCHGNPNAGTSTDFPHTSTFSTFLKDYPDLLCINCHVAGNLP
jgi:predicted CXXCH cytochrome family protein